MSKHVLVTGFQPFDDFKVNPSEMLVRGLEGRLISGRLVVGRVLPAESRTLEQRLREILAEEKPEVIIGTGLAAGRPALALERIAINLVDHDRPDAVGTVRRGDPIHRGGPEARLATLPLDAIKAAWDAQAVPGYVSNTAGTYLCNQMLYTALGLVNELTPPPVCGFIHLPALPSQAVELGPERTPSMTVETMKKGLEVAIDVIVPWLEQKPAERLGARRQTAANSMWIPRGLKEVER
ncbi:MAG: pyrrolidone-carboxylate peptidase [Candidatus Eremiobacteraeota bacterium]|nr:pyrrolidone-carboxylate peptidase [Candidatus Eremiobacteraeota bacterium]